MTLSAIFLLTAVGCRFVAAVDHSQLQDGFFTALLERIDGLEDVIRTQAKLIDNMVSEKKMTDGSYDAIVQSIQGFENRMQRLENIIIKQVQAVDNMKSERQLWLAEKQSLQVSVQHLQTLCLSADVNVERDNTGNDKKVAGQSLESTKQTHNHTVFLRSDDGDPLAPVVAQLTERVNEVNAGLQALKDEVSAGHRELKNEVTQASTSVFVRWGSSTCPASSVLVYSGEVGGSANTIPGAAANYLCLPLSNVTLMDITVNNFVQLYGGEYETADQHYNKDPLCSVCRSSFATNVMIPATTVCPAGWTLEYSGWLMAGNPPHSAASEFICVDFSMEERIASGEDLNGKLLYYTSTVCGSLPCPPYVNGKRVTCVVCSK